MELEGYEVYDYSLEDQNFYDADPPKKCQPKRRVTFKRQLAKCEEAEYTAMVVLKQEVMDDCDDVFVPTPKSLGSIQKVPSLSDLSDPEASSGKFNNKCFVLLDFLVSQN
ncbi:uncharacterized protein LOC112905461 [Agrilus planipennis]|uniref:Uncharacterized protein LOC112905461 n=1 Tax=Agrilus planipennis TaxID=224129 RepID=A0A7F5RCQ6_AGRPL|nr:uncharacterized protein LOC112905461 [Agrilus planipennis]